MVWFGLLGHGLRKWQGYGDWEHWTTKQGLHSDEIWALQQDSRRRIWVADEHGLSILEPGSSRFRSWSEAGIDSPLPVHVPGEVEGRLSLGGHL